MYNSTRFGVGRINLPTVDYSWLRHKVKKSEWTILKPWQLECKK